ncbi:alpha/beta-type small acid-soluble spore protein [Clostridium sp. AL.422]|uniref:alpha/beta-type small acid-soluble spore protein n=1 Tax=Clostridium TaxID=1485 RepID=UPI00293DB68C|nr:MULTISPECIES: alpha/beta-type small acid-soluble spore protein [unclassified Clostridium]MDV4150127.1 alpha/beta-type small acid-soluble spore protein [Clostridium sp. AL.422]
MASNNNGRNKNLVPEAKSGLNRLKNEVASEVGISNYESADKGNLTSKQNGSVGGEMVRRMVEQYEKQIK